MCDNKIMAAVHNSTTLKLCCLERELKSASQASINVHNLTVLYNVAKPCFDTNATYKQVLKFLIKNYHATDVITPDCSWIPQDQCSQSTSTGNIVYVIFWLFVLLIALFGNSLVCIAVSRFPTLWNNFTNHFIVSLAVSDLLVAIFLVPVKMDFTLHNQNFCAAEEVCNFYLTVDNILFTASITNLFVIAVDRYLALAKPYNYATIVSAKRTKLAIMFVWLYAIVIGVLTNFNWESISTKGTNGVSVKHNNCGSNNKWYVTIVFVLVFGLPMIVMGIAYARILQIALEHTRIIASVKITGDGKEPEDCDISRSILKRLRDLKAVRTIATVYGTFLICWVPVAIISLTQVWCPGCLNIKKWQYVLFVEILPILNSTLNFFIYAVMNAQFRNAFKKLLMMLMVRKELFRDGAMGMLRRGTVSSSVTVL